MSAWTWGRVHFTKPRHTLSTAFPELAAELDPPSVPMSGDGDTPQSGSYSPGDPFTMTGMSAARYVFRPVRLGQVGLDNAPRQLGPPGKPALRRPGGRLVRRGGGADAL